MFNDLCFLVWSMSCRFWYESAANLGKGVVSVLPWCLCTRIRRETGKPRAITFSPGTCQSWRVLKKKSLEELRLCAESSADGTFLECICVCVCVHACTITFRDVCQSRKRYFWKLVADVCHSFCHRSVWIPACPGLWKQRFWQLLRW